MLGSVLLLLAAVPTASAGGAWMRSDRDRHEAGEVATLVGYTGGHLPVDISQRFDAFLIVGEKWVPVGALQVEDTGRLGSDSIRVSISFGIPSDLPPGHYELRICGDPCSNWTSVGDIVGGVVDVGVDPPPHSPPGNRPPPDPDEARVPGRPAEPVVATTSASLVLPPAVPEADNPGEVVPVDLRATTTVVIAVVAGVALVARRRRRLGGPRKSSEHLDLHVRKRRPEVDAETADAAGCRQVSGRDVAQAQDVADHTDRVSTRL